MRYSLARPHFVLRLPHVRTYLLRHGDSGRWYVCRDVLHCVSLASFAHHPLRFMAWLRDGLVH